MNWMPTIFKANENEMMRSMPVHNCNRWLLIKMIPFRFDCRWKWFAYTIQISKINPFGKVWWQINAFAPAFARQINAQVEIRPGNQHGVPLSVSIIDQNQSLFEVEIFYPIVEHPQGIGQLDAVIHYLLGHARERCAKCAETWQFGWTNVRVKFGFDNASLQINKYCWEFCWIKRIGLVRWAQFTLVATQCSTYQWFPVCRQRRLANNFDGPNKWSQSLCKSHIETIRWNTTYSFCLIICRRRRRRCQRFTIFHDRNTKPIESIDYRTLFGTDRTTSAQLNTLRTGRGNTSLTTQSHDKPEKSDQITSNWTIGCCRHRRTADTIHISRRHTMIEKIGHKIWNLFLDFFII